MLTTLKPKQWSHDHLALRQWLLGGGQPSLIYLVTPKAQANVWNLLFDKPNGEGKLIKRRKWGFQEGREKRVGNRISSVQTPLLTSSNPLLTSSSPLQAFSSPSTHSSYVASGHSTPQKILKVACVPKSNRCVSFTSSHNLPRVPRHLWSGQPALFGFLPPTGQLRLSPLQVLILLTGSLCHPLLILLSHLG